MVSAEARRNRLPFGIPWIPQGLSAALLAGVFVLGVGTGVTVDSAINTNPKDLASRDAIDKNAPNPKICQVSGDRVDLYIRRQALWAYRRPRFLTKWPS